MDDDKNLSKAELDLFGMQMRAILGSSDDSKRIDVLNDLVENKNNMEESDVIKDMKEIPQMMEEIMRCMSSEDMLSQFGITNFCSYVLALKEFSNKLKPLYIKCLMIKRGNENE